MPRLTYHTVINVSIVLAFMLLAGVLLWQSTRPPPMEFASVSVTEVTAKSAIVLARVDRKAHDCSNGLQSDLRHGGIVTRLPPPVRSEKDGATEYALSLPDLMPGPYEVQVREVFFCPSVRTAETPWLALVVPGKGSPEG